MNIVAIAVDCVDGGGGGVVCDDDNDDGIDDEVITIMFVIFKECQYYDCN